MKKIPGSFKDRSNQVYEDSDKIIRVINPKINTVFPEIFKSNFINNLIENNYIIDSEIDKSYSNNDKNLIFIKHKRINFISYPYEWSNIFLYHAGLKTLELNKYLLEYDYHLVDANAFNMQYIGGKPLLIDIGSIVNYDHKYGWLGMNEFICSFFNPLYFTLMSSIRFNDVYKSFLNGIPSSFIYKIKRLKDFFRLRFILNIFIHERMMMKIYKMNKLKNKNRQKERFISKKKYKSIIEMQENFLRKTYLSINHNSSYWDSYTSCMHNYSNNDIEKKESIITNYIKKYDPKCLLDLGCNNGHFSLLAYKLGVSQVIAVDNDENCIEILAKKVIEKDLPILPLIINFTNESPSHGWAGTERASFSNRAKVCDGSISLALIHHLVIGNNIPLDQAIDWIIQSSKHGVIEFVKKEDSQIEEMLSSRKDIFSDYNIDIFRNILSKKAKIIHEEVLDSKTRIMFTYEK